MKKTVYKYFYLILLFILLLMLDRVTKNMATAYLKDSEPFVLIHNVFEFNYLAGGNSGAAWGILKGQTMFFAIIALVVMALVALLIVRLNNIIFKIRQDENREKSGDTDNTCATSFLVQKYTLLQVIFVVLEAGAAGNLIDRVTEGSVVDFIYFKLIDFPIFNIADCYVTISVILLIILCIFFLNEDEFDMIFQIKKKKGN